MIKVKLDIKPTQQIIQKLGLDPGGDVQRFHTNNVLKRIKRYMPFVSGSLYKLTVAQTDISKPMIVTRAPQAQYLFVGKKMVNAKTGKGPAYIPNIGFRYKRGTVLKTTNIPLNYNKTKNPSAGPRWDRALVANEGKALVSDLQRYIDRRK